MKRLLIVLVLLFVLTACGAGPQAITKGTLRDTLFSVEPRVNGSTSIWLVHDDVGSYCTFDPELAEKAMNILTNHERTPYVIMTYRSLNNNDKESGLFLEAGSGCARERGGSNHITYLLLSIEYANEEE